MTTETEHHDVEAETAATTTATAPEVASDTRARRRIRFRQEAQDVALAMFVERGFETVTMAEVADALDVSERTLFRYFASKEALLDPSHDELLERIIAELQARPAQEPAFVAVREALRAGGDELEHDREAWAARTAIVEANAQLQAHFLQRQIEIEEAITTVVATRSGIDDPEDLRPRLVAAAAVSALRVAVLHWVAASGDDDLLTTIERALDMLASGVADL